MPRADVMVAQTTGVLQFTGGGTPYLVVTPTGVMYAIYVDTGSDLAFKKSLDYGLTWSAPTVIFAGTVVAFSVWYDRWSGIAAGMIYCAYSESGGSDILFRTINTESADALGTQTTVFAGTSTAAGGAFSICRARSSGAIRVAGSIDAGAEDGAWESGDGGATWAGTIADPSEAATQDQYLLLPDFNADTQDVALIFWDASNNELSVKRYDDSANTWTEASIATTMVDTPPATSFPHVAAAVDLTNSRLIVVAWSAVDAANQDLRMWFITNTTITESAANVVLNATDDCHLAAVALDTNTGWIYVFWAGNPDGSEVVGTSVNVYYKVTKDDGATWTAAQKLTTLARNIKTLCCPPRVASPAQIALLYNDDNTIDTLHINAAIPPMPAQPLSQGVQTL